jgi:hypothetical protein
MVSFSKTGFGGKNQSDMIGGSPANHRRLSMIGGNKIREFEPF